MDVTAAADGLRSHASFMQGRSPLYARIGSGFASAIEKGIDGGVLLRLLGTPGPANAVEARLLVMAALHHAALSDPSLAHAAWFPTAVTDARPADEGSPAAAAVEYLVSHESEVAEFLATQRLQTNEIGRCVALLPGFLAAARLGLPLRLLEVGCSAGLNLLFDRYQYRYLNGPSWGGASPVRLECTARGPIPRVLVPPTVDVVERRGVDLRPLRVDEPEDVLLLRSFVWPDQTDRQRHLAAAIELGRVSHLRLDTGDLAAWATEHVRPEEGATTVVFHSAVMDKVDDATAGRFDAAVERALLGAVPGAPVVHLPLEARHGVDEYPDLIAAVADGNGSPRRSTLLTSDWHGRWITWR